MPSIRSAFTYSKDSLLLFKGMISTPSQKGGVCLGQPTSHVVLYEIILANTPL